MIATGGGWTAETGTGTGTVGAGKAETTTGEKVAFSPLLYAAAPVAVLLSSGSRRSGPQEHFG